MRYEKVISTDELDLPDDPETTRTATLVVIFCIVGGPIITTLIMLTVIYAEAIDLISKAVAIAVFKSDSLSFLFVSGLCFAGFKVITWLAKRKHV